MKGRSCLTDREIEELLRSEREGDGSPSAHLEVCDHCRERARAIRANQEFLERLSVFAAHSRAGPAGATLPGYRVLRDLGRGSQGVVCEAVQESTRRRVAIKILSPSLLADPRRRQRFAREATLASGLRHPNVVTVHDSGESSDGRPYLVMEYVKGVPITEFLRPDSDSRPAPRNVLKLFLSVCAGVMHAHQRQVIHRDLKPANILVPTNGEPRIVDFGLAKAIEPEESDGSLFETVEGSFLGTVAYAAPEQLAGETVTDTRADVHALGVILYEMLTGELPWRVEGTMSALVRQILESPPRDPSAFEPRIDGDLRAILRMALEKDPGTRYATVEALRGDVERYLSGDPVEAKRGQRAYLLRMAVRRYRVPLGIGAAFLIVAGALSLFSARQTVLLAREKARLGRALHERNVQLGTTYALAHSFPAAASVLWEEHLTRASERTRWALRSLYLQQPCLATWRGHRGSVTGFALPADGTTVVTGGEDGAVERWSLLDGSHRESLSRDGAAVRAIATDETGRWLGVGRADGSVEVHDLATETSPRSWSTGAHAVEAMALDPSGRVAASSQAGPVRVFTETGELSHELPGEVRSLAFRGSDLLVVTKTSLLVIDPDLGIESSAAPLEGAAAWVGWDSRADRVVWGYRRNDTWTRDLRGGVPARVLPPAMAGAVSRDGGLIALARASGRRRIDVLPALGEVAPVASFMTSSLPDCVAFDGTGKKLCVGHRDGTIQLWDLSPDRTPRALPRGARASSPTFHSVRFDPTGSRIAAGSGDDGRLWLWDSKTSELLGTRRAHSGVVSCVSFSENGRRIASVGQDGTGSTWRLPSLELEESFAAVEASLSWVELGGPGGRPVYAGGRGVLRHPDARDVPRGRDTTAERYACFATSPDGRRIAVAVSGPMPGGAFVSELDRAGDARELRDRERPLGAARCIDWSPGGDRIAVGGDDRVVRVFDARSETLLRRLEGHLGQVFALAFHPDGSILATGDREGSIRLWSTSTWACLTTLTQAPPGRDTPQAVFSLDFHPGGGHLASAGAGDLVLIWDLDYYDRHIEGNRAYEARRLELRRPGASSAR